MTKKRLFSAIAFIMLVSTILLFNFDSGVSALGVKAAKDFHKQNNTGAKPSINKKNANVKYTIDQLTKAVLENDIKLVNKIIESKSVDINGKDSEGKYPIEMVLSMNNCDMAKILLAAGADAYVITSSGKSVYDIAMEEGSKYLKEIFKNYRK